MPNPEKIRVAFGLAARIALPGNGLPLCTINAIRNRLLNGDEPGAFLTPASFHALIVHPQRDRLTGRNPVRLTGYWKESLVNTLPIAGAQRGPK
jgi:hypothetical protein